MRLSEAADAYMGVRRTEGFSPHTLATTLINQGAPLVAVQSLLGHSKPETTLLYARLSGNARRQAFERYFVQ